MTEIASDAAPAPPEVSVIMPVRNGAAFVADAIGSVQRQDGVSFEILARDDGSTDGTLAILQRFALDDHRIKVAWGPCEGPAACRNRCLERASGAFVAFLDHDDLWPDGRLPRQLQRLRAQPDAMAVLGETLMFERLGADGRPASSPGLRRVFAGLLQAGLFRRALFEEVGSFDPALLAADDFDVVLRMIETGCRIEREAEVAVHYRLHAAQHTADLRFTGAQTARAIARSLRRRRARGGAPSPLPPLERP